MKYILDGKNKLLKTIIQEMDMRRIHRRWYDKVKKYSEDINITSIRKLQEFKFEELKKRGNKLQTQSW